MNSYSDCQWPRRVKTWTSWLRRARAAASSVTWTATPPTAMEWRDSQDSKAIRIQRAPVAQSKRLKPEIGELRRGSSFFREIVQEGNDVRPLVIIAFQR